MTARDDQLLPDDELDDENDDDGQPDPELHAKANKQLQNHNKRLESENASLRARVLEGDLATIGLTTESGLGKAIAKEYKGELTAEAVAAYAKEEYGHESGEAPAQVPQAVQATQQIDQLNQASTPVTPAVPTTALEQASQKMNDPNATREDAAASLTEKVTVFADQVYGPGGPTAPPQGQ